MKISVLLPALGGLDIIQPMLKAVQAQTARDQLEIIVLAQHPAEIAGADQVIVTGQLSLHEARAEGVRAATSEFVVLGEDHCFPDPDWAARLLDRLQEGWDGVGPSLRSGNPSNLWAQAAFVLGYGEWIEPTAGRRLPGHNAVVRRSLLLELGPELATELLTGSLLMARLQDAGAKFCFEDRARMAHWDCTVVSWSLITFAAVGAGFGAQRSRKWPWWARFGFALALPAVAVLHWRRALRHLIRTRDRLSIWACFPAMALASAWALGEFLGSLAGVRLVSPYAALGEIKRLNYVGAQYNPPR
jgi:hypothetical protein